MKGEKQDSAMWINTGQSQINFTIDVARLSFKNFLFTDDGRSV